MKFQLGQPKNVKFDSNILDVVVPKRMETAVSTGHPHIDMLLAGDGAIPSTACLVTGLPGTGKTSLMIELADAITSTGNICLYNTGEESLYQIRRVTKRLNLKNGFIPGYNRSVQNIIEHCDKLRKANPSKQLFLMVDSLQTLEIDRDKNEKGRPLSGQNLQLRATELLTEYCKKTFTIMFLVGQVTKKGDFAGKNQIKHVIDCHLHLGIDTDRRSETYNERVAEVMKNRFGSAGWYFGFEITPSGIRFEKS
jgi:DNA repair protein RadA/Sms